jgi:hypothetical protein
MLTQPDPIDLKDPLMNDASLLQNLYSQFELEEYQLTNIGLQEYADLIRQEEANY